MFIFTIYFTFHLFAFSETSDNETFTEDELDANNNHHPLPNHSSNDSAVVSLKSNFNKFI